MSFSRSSKGRRYLRAGIPGRIFFLPRGGAGWPHICGPGGNRSRGQWGGAWARRSLCARAAGGRRAARRPSPVCSKIRNPLFLTALPGGFSSALPEPLILTVAEALRNTAHCWQLPGGLAEL